MDAIGIKPIVAMPTVQARPVQSADLPKSAPAPELPIPVPVKTEVYDAEAVEQKRYAAVQRMAQDIANVNVLGTTTFTIFKDATGVLVTRFRDSLNGEVKYVPEPKLIKMSSADTSPAMTIKA